MAVAGVEQAAQMIFSNHYGVNNPQKLSYNNFEKLLRERCGKNFTRNEAKEIYKQISANYWQANSYGMTLKPELQKKLAALKQKLAAQNLSREPNTLTISERLGNCTTQEEFNEIKRAIAALDPNVPQYQNMINAYEAKIKNDPALSRFQEASELIDDLNSGKDLRKIPNKEEQIVSSFENAGDKTQKVIKEVTEETAEVVDDVAKEGGKVAEKMKGKWGWVIAGAVVLIGAIAAIAKSNKNKQQQQLNAVA